ncbi:MAG: hypothetical protein SOY67_04450 [Collinsella sp.]|nr:hypothetical protein [Collinsella sp.]
MLIREAAEAYLADRRARLREVTVEGYESAIRRHVLPALGCRTVEGVTFEQVQEWVDSIPTHGAARKAFKTFRQMYRWALRRLRLRVWDVTQGIELPDGPSPHRETLTPAGEAAMLAAVEGDAVEAPVVLAAALGLRRCEACAVRVEDVSVALGHSTVDTCIRHYVTDLRPVARRAAACYERAMERAM